MTDYISREAAIMAITDALGTRVPFWETLEKVPAADVVEVVHGEWIDDKSTIIGDIIERNCSLCGQRMTSGIERLMPYCPNCGAQMEGERRDGADNA